MKRRAALPDIHWRGEYERIAQLLLAWRLRAAALKRAADLLRTTSDEADREFLRLLARRKLQMRSVLPHG